MVNCNVISFYYPVQHCFTSSIQWEFTQLFGCQPNFCHNHINWWITGSPQKFFIPFLNNVAAHSILSSLTNTITFYDCLRRSDEPLFPNSIRGLVQSRMSPNFKVPQTFTHAANPCLFTHVIFQTQRKRILSGKLNPILDGENTWERDFSWQRLLSFRLNSTQTTSSTMQSEIIKSHSHLSLCKCLSVDC